MVILARSDKDIVFLCLRGLCRSAFNSVNGIYAILLSFVLTTSKSVYYSHEQCFPKPLFDIIFIKVYF